MVASTAASTAAVRIFSRNPLCTRASILQGGTQGIIFPISYVHGRRLSSSKSVERDEGVVVYSRQRRIQALLLSGLAVCQGGFWAYAVHAGYSGISEPVLGAGWAAGGLALSAAFGGMVNAYLRRNVAEISVVDAAQGPGISVVTHGLFGRLTKRHCIEAKDIVAGPKKDDPKERHWSFGKRADGGRTFYYIVDMKKGVRDKEAVAAVVRGGEHLLVLAHRRRAGEMQGRWKQWEEQARSRVTESA